MGFVTMSVVTVSLAEGSLAISFYCNLFYYVIHFRNEYTPI